VQSGLIDQEKGQGGATPRSSGPPEARKKKFSADHAAKSPWLDLIQMEC